MSNFQITYKYPWLLLLIIPALLLVPIPYFRMSKKLRCTRNRIISMILHTVATVLAINLLSGLSFSYEVPNEENEIIILVDESASGERKSDDVEDFVRSVIDVCDEGSKIGVVKFGYGCKYAAELSADKEAVFEKYLLSEDPDKSATALADALKYTASLFSSPETAKIVVVSDGLETDGDALLTLNELISEGITVDTAFIPRGESADIQIVSATVLESEIVLGESFDIEIVIASNSTEVEEATVLRLYDNGNLYGEAIVGVKNGINEFPASLTFTERGTHELTFELVTDHELFGDPLPDTVNVNNTYRTYVKLEEFENILLIEKYENERAIDPLNEKFEDIDDSKNCEHIFMPIDSTGLTLACTKCGFVVKKNRGE